ncbi:hypothetical protein PTTG_08350 [Puccinia triticina 1-1 BBBD Race 1]|uniref:OTU domain-containing protein n=1 Tax=Puccinia triticina (isolate 1-1 / race 1 (BBBD)) TaxID=630390 RepID=A0A180GNC2_PUCT1|nr:hypothetical protein PTTG_08350 [Puccinia triticina 1-1 BBBD Race 1]
MQQCQRYSAKISDRPPQQAKLLNLFSYGVQQFTATDRYIIGDGNCQSRALSYWPQAKDGVWGDEQTLAAAAEVYKKRIILLSLASPNKPYFVEYGKAYSVDPKRPGLIFWNNHYELLFFQGNRRKFDRI